jgi:hypothetical protein
MKFGFIAKHRNIWPVAWLCNAMGVSRSGFHAWLNRSPSVRSRSDEAVSQQVKASFLASDRTYGARRVWRDLLADGVECGLHRIERLMRAGLAGATTAPASAVCKQTLASPEAIISAPGVDGAYWANADGERYYDEQEYIVDGRRLQQVTVAYEPTEDDLTHSENADLQDMRLAPETEGGPSLTHLMLGLLLPSCGW